jgi:hypothetical protein
MSGNINLNSTARITNLVLPQASTDVPRAGQIAAIPSPSIHANINSIGPVVAWTADPATLVTFTSNTATQSSGIMSFTAITIPYQVTLNGIFNWVTTGATAGTSGAVYEWGLYNTSGTLLARTGNLVPSGFIGATSLVQWVWQTPPTVAAGNYMLGFLWYAGTGGTPVTPIFGKTANATSGMVNAGCPTPSSGKLDQRACTAGSGLTSIYNPMTATPTQTNTPLWVGVY